MRKILLTCIISTLSFYHTTLLSAEAEINFSGQLTEAPLCELNNGETLSLSFGDNVSIKKVALGGYRVTVPLTLECEDEESSGLLKLTLSVYGTPADFDSEGATIVSEQQKQLGIKFYADGNALALDKPLTISKNPLPDLEAVLVKKEGQELDEGHFSATATLRAEYQ